MSTPAPRILYFLSSFVSFKAMFSLQGNVLPRKNECATSLQEEDNVDHTPVQCSYTKQVWFGSLRKAEVQLDKPQGTGPLENWWTESRNKNSEEG
jgi:hypothetical protein